VRIWHKLEDYKDVPKILRAKYFLIDWVYNTYFCMLLFSILHIVINISDSHLFDEFYSKFKGLPALILIHLGAIGVLYFLKWTKPTRTVDKLDNIRDLVRGTITVKPENLFEAYLHFKKTPGV